LLVLHRALRPLGIAGHRTFRRPGIIQVIRQICLPVVARIRLAVATINRVLVQQRHARECLEAPEALVLLHVTVGLHMRPQIRPVGERPRAYVALERLFACVRAHVSLQQPRSTEALAADLALARQSVRADVHLEGA